MAQSKRTAGKARARGALGNKSRRRSVAKAGRREIESAGKARGDQTRPAKSTKIASLTVLLCRIKGVSLDELCKHTGWQPHSVRAVISGVIKKKLGLEVVSEKVGGVRIYRVVV